MATAEETNIRHHRKSRLLNLLLLITSFIGYLEWGGENHMFLFQAEADVISKLVADPQSVIHPFVLIPLAGQLLLLITLFQQRPSRGLTYVSLACIGLLIGFMFIIGLMSLNMSILASTVPFMAISMLGIRHYRNGAFMR